VLAVGGTFLAVYAPFIMVIVLVVFVLISYCFSEDRSRAQTSFLPKSRTSCDRNKPVRLRPVGDYFFSFDRMRFVLFAGR